MTVRIITGDSREILNTLPAGSVHCCVTSPPYYGLRDYGVSGQIGLEDTPAAFDIIWHKPNPMPESIADRCTKAHEYLFLLSKSPRYYFDNEAIKEEVTGGAHARKPGPNSLENRDRTPESKKVPGVSPKSAPARSRIRANESFHEATGNLLFGTRNKRSVWTVATAPFAEAHFATFPPALVEPCILAGTSARGCCVSCGTGWERVVTRSRSNESGSGRAGNNPVGKGGPNAQHAGTTDDIRNGPVITTETIGWYPGCACAGQSPLPPYPEKPDRHDAIETNLWRAACVRVDAERAALCKHLETIKVAPAIVIDPFGGAGTTGLVADRLQRDGLMIELNPDYANMARVRIAEDAGPLFNTAAE